MDELLKSVVVVARRHVNRESAGELDCPIEELSAIGLDSLQIVSFMLDLEASLEIQFPSEMINAETFHSLRTVAESIQRLRSQEMQ
jgi:acyl carrier protein